MPASSALRSVRHTVASALIAATAAASLTVVGGGSASASGSQVELGTLGTKPERAATEAAEGISVAMVELNWSRYEPSKGSFDLAYERMMRGRIDSLRRAGMKVTLGLGLHFSPSWAYALPDSRFVDQHGKESKELNLVFNDKLRDEAEVYLDRVDAAFGLESFWAVRLTSGGHMEVLYPSGGTYWAFDHNAQNGSSMPATMARNPHPGWKPGTSGLTRVQVGAWADWYVGALADVVNWQMTELRRRGFTGSYQVLTPGLGRMPHWYADDVNKNLPKSTTGVGAVWDRFYASLPDKHNVVAYLSSVGDGSGGNVGCGAADTSVALTSRGAESWSSARWLTRIARQHGMQVAGENPGYNPSSPSAAVYRDTSGNGLMAHAMRLATSCGFSTFYWAHDDQLWDGTMPFENLAKYAAAPSAAPPSNSAIVSQLVPREVTNGWGPVEKDRSNGEQLANDGRVLTLNGRTYARGIGVHSNSSVSYTLSKKYARFTATVGVDDEVGSRGSVTFEVWLDGRRVYSTPRLTGADAGLPVSIDVRGAEVLRLVVTDGGDGRSHDHADWADAVLT